MSIKKRIRKTLIKFDKRLPGWCLNRKEKLTREIASTVSSDGVVIDLGAYIGDVSKEFAYYAGKVYSFEPHPEIFKRLIENTKSISNIECIQAAVSDESGVCELYSDPEPSGKKLTQGSSIAQGKENLSYNNSFKVDVVNLPDFIGGLGQPVSLIKMDIEGMEYRVINALLDSGVMDQVDLVYVEDHCDRIPDLSVQRDATLAKIESLGLGKKFNFDWP